MPKLSFVWHVIRPDQRQYRQQEIELLPQGIWIDVEIDAEKMQLDENGDAHISPETMAEVQKKLESVFETVDTVSSNDDEEGWNSKETKTEKKSKPAVEEDDDDGWGDDDKAVETKTPESDNTPWDDTEEDWEG